MKTPNTSSYDAELSSHAMNSGWHDVYAATDVYAGGSGGVWSKAAPPFFKNVERFMLPGSSTLEICAGDGRVSEVLARCGVDLTTLDLSPSALKQLSANFVRQGLQPPLTVVGSATDIPLGDGQFDTVVCINGMCQLDRPRLATAEVARVLRTGGRFIVDVFTPEDQTFGEGEQIGPQDFLFKGCLFRFFEPEQFAGIYAGLFRVLEQSHETWVDPPHGEFRPIQHQHHATVYVLEKL